MGTPRRPKTAVRTGSAARCASTVVTAGYAQVDRSVAYQRAGRPSGSVGRRRIRALHGSAQSRYFVRGLTDPLSSPRRWVGPRSCQLLRPARAARLGGTLATAAGGACPRVGRRFLRRARARARAGYPGRSVGRWRMRALRVHGSVYVRLTRVLVFASLVCVITVSS